MATGVVHGFSVAIWWAVGFLLAAAVIAGVLITARPAATRTDVEIVEERVPVLV